ncbi:hypothetical protein NE237_020833 [Protea cynaroides]|uniref:Disease resistance protein RPS4B/Roq1-like leucine-rich repeats domain-containing protein n=1 Tax=Protea cynaroides TaxID=273540 RepID=A0A9Q0H9Z1_9MAGN|nr:hypothetical protein NE237_020833 [Protea cynaroides]
MFSCRDMEVEKVWLTTEAFSKMPNLRLLLIYGILSHSSVEWDHIEDQNFFFKNLVWVDWTGFPFNYIPNNFHLGNLVILDMQHSQLTEVWLETKVLPKLKVLDLSHSDYLIRTPDFSGMPNLEELRLYDCERLRKVHESIDHLNKLVELDLGACNRLWNLPSGISKLVSLETLDISSCSRLENLPEGIGNLRCLKILDASGTVIEELPSSLGLLKNLTSFSYSAPIGSHCASLGAPIIEIMKRFATHSFATIIQPESSSLGERRRNSKLVAQLSTSLYGFCSLQHLYLGDCNLIDDDIPDDLWKLCYLKSLNLSGNYFIGLPSSVSQLSELETLTLGSCNSLQSLPILPSSLHSLDASGCGMLERLPNLSNLRHLRKLELLWCPKLNEIEGLDGLESVEKIDLRGRNVLESFFSERIFQVISKGFQNRKICEIFLPGSVIPDWFDFRSESSSGSCQVIQLHNMKMQGLIICIVCLARERPRSHLASVELVLVVENQSKALTWNCEGGLLDNNQDRTWTIKIPHYVWKSIAEPGDVINFSVVARHWSDQSSHEERCPLLKFGLHFFYTSHEKV